MSLHISVETPAKLELVKDDRTANQPELVKFDPSANVPEHDTAADAPEAVDSGAIHEVIIL